MATENTGKNDENIQEKIKNLERLKDEFDHANQIKSEFITNISHDLRNPLTAIFGFSQLLNDDEKNALNQQQKEYVNIIIQSTQHALLLINQLLELSKIQYGKLTLNLTSFPIYDVIQLIEKMHSLQLQKKNKP